MADDKRSGRQRPTGHRLDLASFQEEKEAPRKRVGKRSFNAAGARGLAAFDAPREDEEELKPTTTSKQEGARRKPQGPAPEEEDAPPDGMVATSRSFFDEYKVAPGKRGKVEVVRRVADEDEEAPPRKGGGAWKWIVGILVLGGGGAAAAIALTSGGTSPSEPTPETNVASKAPAAEEDLEEEAEPEPAADAQAAAEETAQEPEAKVAAAPASPPMNVSEPAAWAAKVEADNPWVAIAAAPAGRTLGLSSDEARDSLASTRTGFVPGAKFMAPTTPFRILTHEVTWGELAAAATVPDAATFPRPKWLPKDARRHAALPATGVPWAVASAYCRGLGGDLPSEAEWEWAARGPDDAYYPWGRAAFGANEVHFLADSPVPVVKVSTSKLDKTTEGVLDMLGNAREWTRDAWRPSDPAAPADARAATHKAIRGWPLGTGGGTIPAEGSTYRSAGCADPGCMASEGAALEHVGFRCVRAI